eukprot:TRINITY_DN303_c2_g1_i1.p1 TRINITY_DN303_c2_g1~~TRINITY_DN303_c2_g1_i1.p1  ORF type:complete len:468 (-),score=124.62 TRINITY_DN303_c2_g1_i1:244-1647(-)
MDTISGTFPSFSQDIYGEIDDVYDTPGINFDAPIIDNGDIQTKPLSTMGYGRWEPIKKKILLLLSFSGLIGPLTGSMYTPCLSKIEHDFNLSDTSIEISISAAVFTLVIGFLPLLWGPISDLYTRKWLWVSFLGFYMVVTYLATFSFHIWVLIFFRLLYAIPISGIFVVATGIVADIFPPRERGNAMGLLGLVPLSAPIIGPTLAGIIIRYMGWQYTFTILSAIAIPLFLLSLYFLPETLNKEAIQNKKFNPFTPFKLVFTNYRIAIIAGILSSTMPCILVLQLIIGASFGQENFYSLNSIEIGLSLLPIGIGNMIGSITGGRASDRISKKFGMAGRIAIITILNISLGFVVIGFGWSLSWNYLFFPLAFSFFAGLLRTAAGPSAFVYCIVLNPRNAGGVMAALASSQFIAAALGQFISIPIAGLFDDPKIGYAWIMTFLGILTILTSLTSIYLFYQEKQKSKYESH